MSYSQFQALPLWEQQLYKIYLDIREDKRASKQAELEEEAKRQKYKGYV